MQLPFSREQFFDVFAAYNAALWPGALALWIASLAVAVLLFAGSRRASDRVVSTLLAVHWAWSALAYHVAFFTAINAAAWLFGALFLIEAVLFFWWGSLRGTVRFVADSPVWTTVAWALIGYSLLYPAINAAQHGTFSRIPTFGLPCPTTIFTAGLLMLAGPRRWILSIVPIGWSAVGGSAASWLGVRADYALPLAGLALVLALVFQKRHPRPAPGQRPPTGRARAYDGVDSLMTVRPARISAAPRTRPGVSGSPRTTTPTAKAPTAPIPVHTV